MGIRIGTSGWVYQHWRGIFYPDSLRQSDWFSYYAQMFDTVEINNSFYRLPSVAAFAAWRQQAPPRIRSAAVWFGPMPPTHQQPGPLPEGSSGGHTVPAE